MSDIGEAMEKKGYVPLADDGKGAIGFRPSLRKTNRRLGEPVWFYTGLKMKDGTHREVCAHDEAQYGEYIRKGWKPLLLRVEGPIKTGKEGGEKEDKETRKRKKK